MVNFVGRSGELALFSNGSDAAVVNTSLNLVVGVGEYSVLSATREWQSTDEVISSSVIELAAGAVTTLDIKVITAAAGRMYTIPDGAKGEAKKALEWHKEHHRGGTPVGLNTARTLAKGGQIGIEKVRHIAKYFARHEVDKKGKGYKPGQDNFPSNGRIAWALWGGDTAWRWAKAIVERENKKALTAGGYALPGYHDSVETYRTADAYDSSMDAFKMAHELEPEYGPEFMARVRMDGSGIDRLYKVDHDGTVCVWDGKGWDDLGHVEGDIWSYDRALDDPYDHCEKDHFIIDPESAVAISGHMQENPFNRVSLEDIDAYEANLMADGIPDEDWQMVDYALTAAGDSMSGAKGAKPTGAVKAGDGQYTAAERSNIATSAPRDATGKFAKSGGRAVVGNNPATGAGTIVGRSKTPGNIMFKKDSDGQTIDVPAKYSTPEDKFQAPTPPTGVDYGKPLDTSGILGEPRTPNDMPGAQLKGTLPPMTQQDMKSLLNDWPSYVQKQRASFTPTNEADARKYAQETKQKVREVPTVTRTPITTFKDGKLVQQNRVTKQSSPSAVDKFLPNPVKPGVPKSLQVPKRPAVAKPTGQPGAWSTAVKKAPSPYKPIGNNKTAENARKGLLMGPLSGRGPVTKSSSSAGPAPQGNFVRGQSRMDGRPGSTVNPKGQPGAWDTGKNGTGRPGIKSADPRNAPGSNRQTTPASKSQFDDKGRYVVQKGDNLWSISDKNKPKGQTTAQYWNKVLDANKGKFKSGNPSLIYSGERVTLPGVGKPMSPAEKRNADAKAYGQGIMQGIAKDKAQKAAKQNSDAKQYGQGILAGKAKAKAEADKRNADAKAYGQGRIAGNAKAKAAADAKRNADAKEIGTAKLKAAAKVKAASDKRNADAKAYGQGIKSGIAQKRNADAKAYGQGILSGKAKAQAQADKRNADAKAYGKGIMSGQAKAKAAADAKRNSDAKAYGQGIKSGIDKAKADAAKRNADAKAFGEGKKAGIAKKRNDDAREYGQGIMKGIAKDKAQQSSLDDKGRYVVKKGDSLWSIADKNKPSNESTANYWSKVMKANPKENFKSGNPSLIYSGERVNLPGVKKNAPKMTPSQKLNAQAKEYGEGKLAGIAKSKAEAAKRNADAKEIGQAKKAGIAKSNAQKSAKANADAKELGKAKQSSIAKSKAQSAKINADAKQLGEAKKASQPKATPKPFLNPVKPGVPKSLQKPAPSKQPQKPAPSKQPEKNPIREALEGIKKRTTYKQEVFVPASEQKAVKRGKAGTRKRNQG